MKALEIERMGDFKWCVVVDLDHVGRTPVLRWLKSKRAAEEARERIYTLPLRWEMTWRIPPHRPDEGRWVLADQRTMRLLLEEQHRILTES